MNTRSFIDERIQRRSVSVWHHLLPEALPDSHILPEALPDSQILPEALPDSQILPEALPDSRPTACSQRARNIQLRPPLAHSGC